MLRVRIGERRSPVETPRFRPPGISRRDFLRVLAGLGAGGGLASVLGPAQLACVPDASLFPEGVICGDPQPDGAVIWTRLAPPPDARPVELVWMVAEDPELRGVLRGGMLQARAEDGYSVKVDVRELPSDRWYWYAFFAGGARSRVGRLRTAPAPGSQPDRVRYGFASCQQRTASFYNAHRALAREDVDFMLHLGDYIYASDFGDLSVDDYRQRWATFKSNPLLQELHAKVPLVAMWDDGEFYNGVDRTGPPERLHNARTAWFENMPVLRREDDRVYRGLRWGRLADLFMIDVRSYRDPEVPANVSGALFGLDVQDSRLPGGAEMFAPGRTTLGIEQKEWLLNEMAGSAATWQLIGNPYNMNPWRVLDLDDPADRARDPELQRNGGVYVSNEAWDDYQVERRELLTAFAEMELRDVIFTSGHTHFYLASELQPDFDDPASPTVAFDFVTGSLTADPDPRTLAPVDVLRTGELLFKFNNAPYLKHVDLVEQGYALVEVTPDETLVEFRGIDTYDIDAEPRTFARFRVVRGSGVMEVLPAG